MPILDVLSSTEFVASIVGAVVGTIGSGAISARLQRSALGAAKRQWDEDRDDARKALGHSLFFKVIRIHGNYHTLCRYIEAAIKRGESHGMTEAWQAVQPMTHIPENVHFSTDEMALLLPLKSYAVFNPVMEIDGIHNAFLSTVRILKEQQTSLTEQLTVRMSGELGEVVLTREDAERFRPRMHEINSLVAEIRSSSTQDLMKVGRLLTDLQTLLKERLKLGVTMTDKAIQAAEFNVAGS